MNNCVVLIRHFSMDHVVLNEIFPRKNNFTSRRRMNVSLTSDLNILYVITFVLRYIQKSRKANQMTMYFFNTVISAYNYRIPVLRWYHFSSNINFNMYLIFCRGFKYHEPTHSLRTKFMYNNYMYSLGGYIAEILERRPWQELIQEYIFDPLNMTS